jgi:hypothetical protein
VLVIAFETAIVAAHDLERTQVTLTFARDGAFVLDVANDPAWLKLRLDEIPGSFADRVVLWVDGREVRPASVEFLPAPKPDPPDAVVRATYRMRGHMPLDAHTLRWFYGIVIDPYPLTIRRADGRVQIEEIQGNAWSRTIDVSGQFHAPLLGSRASGALVVAVLLVPILLMLATKTRKHEKEDRFRFVVSWFRG